MDPNALGNIVSIKTGLAPVAASSASAGGEFSDSRASEEADRAVRYRLVIEQGARSGSYIYKTLDRITGEVIQQLPREDVVKLTSGGAYAAGQVIDTQI